MQQKQKSPVWELGSGSHKRALTLEDYHKARTQAEEEWL